MPYHSRFEHVADIGLSLAISLAAMGLANRHVLMRYLAEREKTARLLQDAIEARKAAEAAMREIKVLRGMLPICATCKKIRDDDGYWNQAEQYIAERSEAEFSHGICPECAVDVFGEFASEFPTARQSAPAPVETNGGCCTPRIPEVRESSSAEA